jgi:hypothetical protein
MSVFKTGNIYEDRKGSLYIVTDIDDDSVYIRKIYDGYANKTCSNDLIFDPIDMDLALDNGTLEIYAYGNNEIFEESESLKLQIPHVFVSVGL